MHIHEAAKKAMKIGGKMVRLSAVKTESEIYSAITPTNSYDACLLTVMKNGKPERTCRWWNPTADDLMARDWVVIKDDAKKEVI